MPEFSLSSMDKILRRAGNDRVSEDASLELSAVLESYGEKIAEEAMRIANQEDIVTIKSRHIRKAKKEIEK